MNERIQKLIERSTQTVDISKKLGMPGTDQVFDKERFARLIIQECIKHLYLREIGFNINEENKLRKHFGIEE